MPRTGIAGSRGRSSIDPSGVFECRSVCTQWRSLASQRKGRSNAAFSTRGLSGRSLRQEQPHLLGFQGQLKGPTGGEDGVMGTHQCIAARS